MVPLLHRYYEVLRLPTARPARLRYPSTNGYLPCACVRSTRPDAGHAAGGFAVWQLPHATVFPTGDGRVSQVPGEPSCAYALLFDPGRTDAPGLKVRQRGPRSMKDEGSRDYWLSRLNHTALALAVYASSDGSLHQDARLASRCWPDSTGRDWLPAGFRRKVSENVRYMLILLSQAWPGAIIEPRCGFHKNQP